MAEKEKSFDKVDQSTKTYSLVELVRAPTEMVDKGPENTVFAFPLVALVEIVLTLVVAVVLLTMSFAVNAPLEEIANPNLTTDPAKAPWYLMGLQEMLEHGHPTFNGSYDANNNGTLRHGNTISRQLTRWCRKMVHQRPREKDNAIHRDLHIDRHAAIYRYR